MNALYNIHISNLIYMLCEFNYYKQLYPFITRNKM